MPGGVQNVCVLGSTQEMVQHNKHDPLPRGENKCAENILNYTGNIHGLVCKFLASAGTTFLCMLQLK